MPSDIGNKGLAARESEFGVLTVGGYGKTIKGCILPLDENSFGLYDVYRDNIRLRRRIRTGDVIYFHKEGLEYTYNPK